MTSESNSKNIFPAALLLVLNLLLMTGADHAAAESREVKVAVATNFIRTMDELSGSFEKKAGTTVKRSSAATGILYSQILNGAPYDLFLAADQKRPELLQSQGLCEVLFTYASGRVVLWSSREDLAESDDWRKIITGSGISRIAIANPELAPYGEAAKDAMEKAGVTELVKKRLVYGQNVSQAFQYSQQGAADVAFVALSLALSEHGRKGKMWQLPEAPSVVQKACLLKNSANKESAQDLIAYLQTEQAKTILSESGYEHMR